MSARLLMSLSANLGQDLLPLFHSISDDGHTIKLARAIHICRDLMQKHGDKPWARIKTEEQWVRLSYLVLDSAERPAGIRWARSAGFDEAWKVGLPNR
jgi:hypothetical protein